MKYPMVHEYNEHTTPQTVKHKRIPMVLVSLFFRKKLLQE